MLKSYLSHQEDAEVEASIPSGQEADSEPEELTIKILYIQVL